jgi:hypothetical protein
MEKMHVQILQEKNWSMTCHTAIKPGSARGLSRARDRATSAGISAVLHWIGHRVGHGFPESARTRQFLTQ